MPSVYIYTYNTYMLSAALRPSHQEKNISLLSLTFDVNEEADVPPHKLLVRQAFETR